MAVRSANPFADNVTSPVGSGGMVVSPNRSTYRGGMAQAGHDIGAMIGQAARMALYDPSTDPNAASARLRDQKTRDLQQLEKGRALLGDMITDPGKYSIDLSSPAGIQKSYPRMAAIALAHGVEQKTIGQLVAGMTAMGGGNEDQQRRALIVAGDQRSYGLGDSLTTDYQGGLLDRRQRELMEKERFVQGSETGRTAMTNATSRANNRDTNATHVTTTGMTNETSRLNNTDTNATSRANNSDTNAAHITTTGMTNSTSRANNADTIAGEIARATSRDAVLRANNTDTNATSRANNTDTNATHYKIETTKPINTPAGTTTTLAPGDPRGSAPIVGSPTRSTAEADLINKVASGKATPAEQSIADTILQKPPKVPPPLNPKIQGGKVYDEVSEAIISHVGPDAKVSPELMQQLRPRVAQIYGDPKSDLHGDLVGATARAVKELSDAKPATGAAHILGIPVPFTGAPASYGAKPPKTATAEQFAAPPPVGAEGVPAGAAKPGMVMKFDAQGNLIQDQDQ